MSGFQVGVGALSAPAQRLKQVSADLTTASSGAGSAAGVGGAAGDPRVATAAEVFKAGVTAVLGALGQDAALLADKVQQAGVTYEAVDRANGQGFTGPGPGSGPGSGAGSTAGGPGAPTTSPPTPKPAPAPAPEPVRIAAGDSLWAIAAEQAGPGASRAEITAEVHRWYAANRDAIGPDPDLIRPGTTLRAPEGAR